MTEIKIVKNPVKISELKKMAEELFGNFVKAVVDTEQGIMAVGGSLHADEEIVLSEKENSSREHTWGINIYPDEIGDKRIEFDSMVNIKPAFGNRTRGIDSEEVRKKILEIVEKLLVA